MTWTNLLQNLVGMVPNNKSVSALGGELHKSHEPTKQPAYSSIFLPMENRKKSKFRDENTITLFHFFPRRSLSWINYFSYRPTSCPQKWNNCSKRGANAMCFLNCGLSVCNATVNIPTIQNLNFWAPHAKATLNTWNKHYDLRNDIRNKLVWEHVSWFNNMVTWGFRKAKSTLASAVHIKFSTSQCFASIAHFALATKCHYVK
jgi:hypothetical protein